eukprot:TRINITY_DN4657_c0_g1_i1.p1 TRINITY_DN4657_c0_g1~~TRINITY_DN4657_c0_g1_i1.p1  ORF type:complete len:238 (+),score=46.11 TRINITY_DN4657_c0_g1_i1:59-715(+)
MGCSNGKVAPMGEVVERYTGAPVSERIHPTKAGAQKLLCLHQRCECCAGTSAVRRMLQTHTDVAGKMANSAESKKAIPAFIDDYGVAVDDAEHPAEHYPTLNAFFTRRLKPGLRPIAADDGGAVAVQPADCRLHVFPSVTDATELYVKGKGFSLKDLIGADDPRAAAYASGTICISRLAPAFRSLRTHVHPLSTITASTAPSTRQSAAARRFRERCTR